MHSQTSHKLNNNKKIWFTVPYIKSISDKFENIIKGLVSRVSFYSMNKLSRLIKAQKDSLPDSSKMNVVYKINCKDCDASMWDKQADN